MGQYRSKIEVTNWTTLKPGDHIYTDRKGDLYYHHGIYVGDYMVIHFGPTKNENSSPTCHKCGHNQESSGTGIVKSCLDCFKGTDHNLYLYEYVNRYTFVLKQKGTCCPMPSKPADEVVKNATDLLHGKGFKPYDFVSNNCEDFAVYCKTGVALSMQALGKFNILGFGDAYLEAKAIQALAEREKNAT